MSRGHQTVFTLSFVLMAGLATGCASITRGTSEKVTIISEPSGAMVTTDIGLSCPAAPCTLDVKRRQEFTAYGDKPGYRRGSVKIGIRSTGRGNVAMAGNLIAGGVVGMVVDGANGSNMDHYPNPAVIVLEPAAGKPAPKPRRKRPDGVPSS